MHIRGFDGLRAVAILLVFAMHKTAWGTDALIGYAGVWLFFLLSGFLIGGQLRVARHMVERGESRVGRQLALFWLKRAMRIFPAYYLVLGAIALFYLAASRPAPGLPFYVGYLSNIYFQFNPEDFATTWAHFWSLAVEEQFYILFAPLMLFIPARHAAKACWALVGVSLAQRFGLAAWGVRPTAIYVDSLVNFGLLALGALLFIHRDAVVRALRAWRLDGDIAGAAALSGVIVAVPLALTLAGPRPTALQGMFCCAVGVAALLLMHVVAAQRGPLVTLLEWRPLAHVGRISYGLYLYNDYVKDDLPARALRWAASHGNPAGGSSALARALLPDTAAGQLALQAGGLAVCFAVLFGVAHLSWIAVERPALRWRNRAVAMLEGRAPLPDDPLREEIARPAVPLPSGAPVPSR